MNEVAAAIYTTLAAGTALVTSLGGTAIYQQQAPEGAALPYVVFSKQTGGPLNDHGADARELFYFIRAYANSAKTAGAVDASASALLHRQNITVSGHNTVWCWRETDLESVQTPQDGEPVYMAGAVYRIRIV